MLNISNMEGSSSTQLCHCRRQSVNVLTVVVVILLGLTCSVLVMQLAQRAEFLKIIEKNRKDRANLREDVERLKSIVSGMSEAKRTLNQEKLEAKNSANSLAGGQDSSQKGSRRSVSGNSSISCPFRKRRLKRICLLVRDKVSEESGIIKAWVNETLKKFLDNYFKYQNVHAHLLFKERNYLKRATSDPTRYCLSWDIIPDFCQNPGVKTPDEIQKCRTCRISPSHAFKLNHEGNKRTEKRNLDIKIAGNYLVSCQLVMKFKPTAKRFRATNVANLIAKVSVLMSRKDPVEDIELLSQVPFISNLTDGTEKTTLFNVAMTGQAYLYKDSKIRITVTLKKSEEVPTTRMGLVLYEHLKMNWFDIKLLDKNDDSRSRTLTIS